VDGVTAVVGDSVLALRSATELARVARRVTLIAASEAELSTPLGRFLIAMPNVTILTGFHVERITGDDYARGLVVSRHGEQREVAADAIFVEQGLVANSELVAQLVARDPGGRILVDINNRTSAPGLFAAGDVTNVYTEQVLVAIGEGTKAALSAYDYLLEHPVLRVTEAPEWR
jgi:alkyl hydroperoxide reductase subunit AhpF